MDKDVILEMRSITKEFPGVKALSEVSLEVVRGEIHAICGENGAGKSTLMNVLSGVYPYGTYDGEIVYEGQVCKFGSINDSEKAGIVIIHQELALSPYLSIAENIFIGNERARSGWIDWSRTETEARDYLARVGLHDNPSTKVLELGVGKQQLVEIAKALSKEVKLLILDEPTAALNDDDSERLLELMLELKEQGVTCILISHKLNEIKRVADTVTIIRDGHTIETLNAASPEVNEDRIIKGMVGRDMTHRFPDHTPRIGQELLRIEDWTVHDPNERSRIIVDKANLRVNEGEIVGIAGLMGAGRTELAMSVFGGSWGADISGSVFKRGEPIDVRTVPAAIKAGLAYATEDRKQYGLNLIEDVARNISSVALDKLSKLGWVDRNREYVVAERYREEMSIKTPSVSALVGKLSGGNQQKVVLSKWMFSDPEVLILDEPTRGIDVGAKYEIYTIINRLADAGRGIIVISSELPELIGLCDRIYTLSEGVITANIERADFTPELIMTYMTKIREEDHV